MRYFNTKLAGFILLLGVAIQPIAITTLPPFHAASYSPQEEEEVVVVLPDPKRTLPLVIIRIEFNDYQFASSEKVWSDKIFGTKYGNLNHYYHTVSYGDIEFAEINETHATKNDGIVTIKLGINHPGNTSRMYAEALNAIVLTDPYVNYSSYDKDGNGAISNDELQIMFLVAGGESATGAAPGVWAHRWCYYGGNGTPPVLDDVTVMSCSHSGGYSRFGEKHFNAKTGNDATIGAIAHELGHSAFGFIDLYDTDGSSQGIGRFGLMGGGAWGKVSLPGDSPSHLSGPLKIKAGFVEPVIAPSVATDNLKVYSASNPNYKPYVFTNVSFSEYFVVENRSNEGYDRGLNLGSEFKAGLLVWHVNTSSFNNSNENRKRIDVEEAENPGLDTNRHSGDVKNLFFNGGARYFASTTPEHANTKLDFGNHYSSMILWGMSDPANVMTMSAIGDKNQRDFKEIIK